MRPLLLIIDMQNGFISKETTPIVAAIETLINHFSQQQLPIAFTRFINTPESSYVKWMNWSKLMSAPEINLIAPFCDIPASVFDKEGYTAFTDDFEQFLTENAINTMVICGVETDGCVLKTALDAFEKNVHPLVVVDACASNAGSQLHDAGLLLLSRLIGEQQIMTVKDIITATQPRI